MTARKVFSREGLCPSGLISILQRTALEK